MKDWIIKVLLVATVVALAGCGGAEATPAAGESIGQTYTSAVLDTSYEGALGVSNQLVLGTLELEETESAITPEQAKSLLPLWRALQGGVTAQAEVNAVLKQIEGTMTQEQLQAIAGLQLTNEDMQAWMQEHEVGPDPGSFPSPGEGISDEERAALQATRQAEGGGGGIPPGGGEGAPFGGGPGGGEMSPEMATRRAEFEGMSDEEREAMQATMQASGSFPGGRGGAGGSGQFPILLSPLLELLEARAGEA
jgi:hypothetical protein